MKIVYFGVAILVFVGLMALSTFVIMWAWNGLAGYFGFKTINFFISLLINLALMIVGSTFKSSNKS